MLVTLFYDFMGSPLPTRGQCIHRALPTRCVLLSFSSTTDSYSKFLRIVLQLKNLRISPLSIRQFLQKSSFCCNNPKPH